MQRQHFFLSRTLLALLVALSGLLMLPLSGLSAETLNWQMFAGVYDAEIDIVSDDDQAHPGSAFHFVATGFPANSVATVEIDGRTRGAVMTDSNGRADFLIQTDASDAEGRFYVTAYTDANFYVSEDFRLRNDKDFQAAPANWNGYVFSHFGPAVTLTVEAEAGNAGSAFVFNANGFASNAALAISIDGTQRHTTVTDSAGKAQFAVQTSATNARAANSAYGTYYVSVEAGGEVYALAACSIDSAQPTLSLPSNFSGDVILLSQLIPTAVSLQSADAAAPSSYIWLALGTLLLTTFAGLVWFRPK